MAETVQGRTPAEIRALFASFRAMVGSGDPVPRCGDEDAWNGCGRSAACASSRRA